jgi:ATP-dependent Clp protease ATP-binding subunit ClpC
MEIGYEPALGARPLRRAVQREIEDRISEQILQGELKNSSHIVVDFEGGEFVFVSKLREGVTQAV